MISHRPKMTDSENDWIIGNDVTGFHMVFDVKTLLLLGE